MMFGEDHRFYLPAGCINRGAGIVDGIHCLENLEFGRDYSGRYCDITGRCAVLPEHDPAS